MLKTLAALAMFLALTVNPAPPADNEAPVPDTKSVKDAPQLWYKSPEWWLFILGVPTLIFIAVQAIASKKAAEAAEASAKATHQQTEHMIASERPFLMIEAIRNGTFVKFQAINRGKSPARVIFFGESPNFDTPLYSEETWNPVPHYGYGYDIEGAEIINIPWIAPGDTPWVFSTYDLRVLEEFDPARHTECATGARAVYLWHTVKYKGLSGTTIYESRFCYQAINGKLKMAGPYGLNQYT